jgi:hypothetical protein
LEHGFYGTETWTLQKVDQKKLECFDMVWKRMEKISWTNCIKNEEVLHRVKEDKKILHAIKQRKMKWIDNI